MKLTHFIGGEALAADTSHDCINSSDTYKIVASCPAGGTAEVDAAVSATRRVPGVARGLTRNPWRDPRPGRRDASREDRPRRRRRLCRKIRECPSSEHLAQIAA